VIFRSKVQNKTVPHLNMNLFMPGQLLPDI
jgi:hypothetical protein